MKYLLISMLVVQCLVTTGCTPLSAVGMVGNTFNRTMQNMQDRKGPPPDKTAIAVANVNLGVAYIRQRDYEKALEKFDRAIEAKPNHAPTYNALGLLYQRLGDYDKAEKNYKKSIRLDKDAADARNNYGQFLCGRDRLEEAQEQFLEAANNPLYDRPEIPFTNAGTCALIHEDKENAENYFKKALSINPRMATALIQMSQLAFEKGNYLSARGYLERYLEIAKHTAKSLWLGIQIERQLGDKDTEASYALLLRNNFADSREAGLFKTASSIKTAKRDINSAPNKQEDPKYRIKTVELINLLGEQTFTIEPVILDESTLLNN